MARIARPSVWVAVAVLTAGIAGITALLLLSPPPRGPVTATPDAGPAARLPRGAGSLPGLLAVVVDDAGNDERLVQRVLDLPAPLTIAVLPHRPGTGAVPRRVVGKEVILHLPMEPIGYPEVDPGAGALLTSMDRSSLVRTLDDDLAQVPGATGVNNHMGSRFTADRERVAIVVREVRSRGLFLIDSRTTAATTLEEEARRLGVPVLPRDIFLDDPGDEATMRRRWRDAVELAASRGWAVVIGHARSQTIAFLAEALRGNLPRGVRPVTLSTLLEEIARVGARV